MCSIVQLAVAYLFGLVWPALEQGMLLCDICDVKVISNYFSQMEEAKLSVRQASI